MIKILLFRIIIFFFSYIIFFLYENFSRYSNNGDFIVFDSQFVKSRIWFVIRSNGWTNLFELKSQARLMNLRMEIFFDLFIHLVYFITFDRTLHITCQIYSYKFQYRGTQGKMGYTRYPSFLFLLKYRIYKNSN